MAEITITVDEDTDPATLVNHVFVDVNDELFTILSADQEPALKAIAYGARNETVGFPFASFVPWGSTLTHAA